MANNGLLGAWLRDAIGMEKALAGFVDTAIKDFEGQSGVQEKLQTFRETSEQTQAELMTGLEDVAEDESGLKKILGSITGAAIGLGSSLYRDDSVKDVLVLHGAFHFAHACYVSLAQAAESLGNDSLARMSRRLADKRMEMATWAMDILPDVTEDALMNQES